MIFAALAAMTVAGCGGNPGSGGINDPFEPMNRQTHAFNRGFDANVVKPATSGLSSGLSSGPSAGSDEPGIGSYALQGIGNFGSNLAEPGKALNHLLQGRPEPAVKTTFRFLVNSTLGIAGFLDPATADFALPEQDTDFGETLHVWGVGEGPYLELPLLGPSTVRDTVGRVVDLVIDPMHQVLDLDEWLIGLGARAVAKAGERARFGDSVDSILHESADSYAQTRLIWLQHRRHELGQEGDEIDPYAE
ncbi:VacJ family lipoprotein [Paracoccus sp. MBLB3053]|uniref:VacJ family lipoprotein n=1 Tax=Paracoccus aurantius TaxID=3073814 RepID=A0ABU2HNT3_9RHOB|nr:VacJ family lipoprotein [Paracoccus sp. MBLB3053]MDS9466284.1 VacJ family lipoprotein [Paracoccus sp. MBLB3053]